MNEAPEAMQSAVDRYVNSVRVHQLEPGPPDDPVGVGAVIAEIEREIAPFSLPDELKWFWRTWNPYGFADLPFPQLTPPDFALESYRMFLTEGLPHPVVLFPIAYQSHCFLLVELIHDLSEGSRVYWYCYDEGEYKLQHLDPAEIFNVFVDALESVESEQQAWEDEDARWMLLDEAWDEAHRVTSERIEQNGPANELTVSATDPLRWPERWQKAQGLDPARAVPLGRTHTIVQFEEARQRDRVEGRLVGEANVISGGGIAPDGPATLLELRDETGATLVLVPSTACPFGNPRGGDRYELEVIGEPTDPADLDLTDVNAWQTSITRKARARDYLAALQESAESGLAIHQALVRAGQAAIRAVLVRPLHPEAPEDAPEQID